ncbi:MAG: metal-sensitive transcriptional regulator [Syntrophomonas sp.]
MSEDASKDVLLRLKRIEGQVRGIQRMIEDKADCGEVLNQVAAIKAAINRVGIIVFEKHARECILESVNENNEERFQDIITMMGRLIK